MTVELKQETDEALRQLLSEHGSVRAAAQASGVPRSSLQDECHRRGITLPAPRAAPRRGRRPHLTRESLHQALLPPNNCKVKALLDGLDEESYGVVEEALAYDKKDFPSASLRDWLIAAGFREQDVPGSDAINDHRAGRRPCRCRG